MKFLFSGLIISIALGSSAFAQSLSGNELYEACTTDNDAMAGFCSGFIIGQTEGKVFGGLLFAKGLGIDKGNNEFNKLADIVFHHCIPNEASNLQLQDVVVKYLIEHPNTRHESARFLIWEAYVEAFPCSLGQDGE